MSVNDISPEALLKILSRSIDAHLRVLSELGFSLRIGSFAVRRRQDDTSS
jgi:hypothetical protein